MVLLLKITVFVFLFFFVSQKKKEKIYFLFETLPFQCVKNSERVRVFNQYKYY